MPELKDGHTPRKTDKLYNFLEQAILSLKDRRISEYFFLLSRQELLPTR